MILKEEFRQGKRARIGAVDIGFCASTMIGKNSCLDITDVLSLLYGVNEKERPGRRLLAVPHRLRLQGGT